MSWGTPKISRRSRSWSAHRHSCAARSQSSIFSSATGFCQGLLHSALDAPDAASMSPALSIAQWQHSCPSSLSKWTIAVLSPPWQLRSKVARVRPWSGADSWYLPAWRPTLLSIYLLKLLCPWRCRYSLRCWHRASCHPHQWSSSSSFAWTKPMAIEQLFLSLNSLPLCDVCICVCLLACSSTFLLITSFLTCVYRYAFFLFTQF